MFLSLIKMSNHYRFFTLSRTLVKDLEDKGRFQEVVKYLESSDRLFHTEFIVNVALANESKKNDDIYKKTTEKNERPNKGSRRTPNLRSL